MGPVRRTPRLRVEPLLLGLLLVDVAIVRWLALGTEPWLDEIWSWRLAIEEARGLADLLTGPRLQWDNNHLLNTAYMHMVGRTEDFRLYRLLAWAAGVGAVAAAWWVTSGESRLARWVAVLAVAFSYPLAVHGTEARGYAPVSLFALLAYGLQRGELDGSRWWRWSLLQLCILAGYLAHLSFVFVHAALAAWAAWRLARRSRLRRAALDALRLHGPGLAIAALLYLVFARHAVSLPGPEHPLARVLLQTVAHALGAPGAGPLAWLAALLAVAALAHALWRMRGAGDDIWVFHLVALILAPAALLATLRPPVVYARYFVVCLPFLYLVLGRAAAGVASLHRLAALPVAALLLASLAGHIVQTHGLLTLGRGRYREALKEMARRTRGAELHVGSTSDACVADVLRYNSRALGPGRRVRYLESYPWVVGRRRLLSMPDPARPVEPGGPRRFTTERWSALRVEWLVVPSTGPLPRVPGSVRERGARCHLVGAYPSLPLSGQHWYVYKCR